MRPIKFRAWDGKKMHLVGGIVFDEGKIVEIDDDSGEYFCGNGRPFDWKLMQFTGLLDKNGKEIYEGDMVKYQDFIGISESEVKYELGIFTPLDYRPSKEMEVIGNIYENPELIA